MLSFETKVKHNNIYEVTFDKISLMRHSWHFGVSYARALPGSVWCRYNKYEETGFVYNTTYTR